jgi:ParB family chromosome partitioning protein
MALIAVPCVVRTISELEAVELALLENGQRHDLNPIEEAEGYYRLFEAGRSLTDMAARLGRSAKHISGRLVLLELPKKAQRALEHGSLTLAHANALLEAREHPDLIEAVIDARVRPTATSTSDAASSTPCGNADATRLWPR